MIAEGVKHLTELRSVSEWSDWRWHIANSINTIGELRSLLGSSGGSDADWSRFYVDLPFRFGVTPYFLSLVRLPFIRTSLHSDPILLQILPDASELTDPLYHDHDPLCEEEHTKVRGVIHRYPDRALWYVTGRCASYCRFCFRKKENPRAKNFTGSTDSALEYFRTHTELKEVILSGGDPFMLSDDKIINILRELKKITHLSSIRIHTRMLSFLPFRFTDEFAARLREFYPLTIVAHFNHPLEITQDASYAIRNLRMSGVQVLNQSVLLKNINNDVSTMGELLLLLVRSGVMPYYLHRLDEVKGVSRFRVPLEEGVELLRKLRGNYPGIAIPRYVADLPGGGGKIALEPDWLVKTETTNPDTTDAGGESRIIRSFTNFEGREFLIKESCNHNL